MRYLHTVQAHERFVASGSYRYFKNDIELAKTENWTIHELGDGSRFIRIDLDARPEGKSILAELLTREENEILRFDIRYENRAFEGGIKSLSATYQFGEDFAHVGYALNNTERRYLEVEYRGDTLVDVPLLVVRGKSLEALSRAEDKELSVFVPMFEHAQLFPGATRLIRSQVEYVGEESLHVGGLERLTHRYRYLDKAASYWVDDCGIVVKRVNAYNRDEFVVLISDYAHRAA